MLKLKANPTNPTYDVVFGPRYTTIGANKSFGSHGKELLKEANIKINCIIPNSIPDTPVWDSVPIDVNFSLSEYDKSSTSSDVFLSKFNELKEIYSESCHMYTDGSKADSKVACAVVIDCGTRSYRLRDDCSIFTAEIEAIQKV